MSRSIYFVSFGKFLCLVLALELSNFEFSSATTLESYAKSKIFHGRHYRSLKKGSYSGTSRGVLFRRITVRFNAILVSAIMAFDCSHYEAKFAKSIILTEFHQFSTVPTSRAKVITTHHIPGVLYPALCGRHPETIKAIS